MDTITHLVQFFFAIASILSVFVLPVAALARLKAQPFSDRDFMFWAAIVLLFPLLGAIAVLIAFPRHPNKPKNG